MGINGLHSYITTECKGLFSSYELKKTKLIVDGNSTSQYLFNQWKNRNNMFGVDYYSYARSVRNFFNNLQAEFDNDGLILVVIDGNWESQNDESTVLSSKQSEREVRHKHSDLFIFPKDVSFRIDVFLEIIKQLKIEFLMCTFEADHTIATIAKIFNCPVLTNSPEFFLYGNDCIFLDFITFNELKNTTECSIFGHNQILKKFTGLNISCLPLLSVLLNQGCFTEDILRCFLKLQPPSNIKLTEHEIIEAALNWLQNQTLDLAAEKILSWMTTVGNSLELSQKLIEDTVNHYSTMSTYMLHHLTFPSTFDIPEEKIYSMEKKFFVFKFKDKNQLTKINNTRCHINYNQDMMKKKFERSIPYWFLSEYLEGKYSPFVLYLIKHHAYIPWHELKGFSYPSEYEISIPLLSLLYNLAISCINTGKIKLLSLILEKDNDLEHYGRITLRKELSKLDTTRNLEINMRSNIINKDLGINYKEDFQDIPNKWRLYVATIVFWLKQKGEPLKNESHLNAMLLALFFNIVEEQIGFTRDYDFFRKRFHATIERISSRKIFKHKGLNLDNVIKEITYNDCIMAANFFLPLLDNELYSFQITNDTPGLTDVLIQATHVYAQFKICLEHSKDINALLKFPYQQTVISETFHESLIFNLFIDMSQQSMDIDSYIAEKLKHSPTILNAFTLLRDRIDTMMQRS